MPDHWIARAWPVDTAAITRWIVVTTSLETPSGPLVLVCRILGWDQSELPSWTVAAENGRIRITVEERTITTLLDLLDESTRARLDRREVRRVEPPVRHWFRGLSSETWGLHVPLVAYEVWAEQTSYAQASAQWGALTADEKSAFTLPHHGYLGSTVFLIPQNRAFFVEKNLVIPGGPAGASGFELVSEVLDGPTVLARSASALQPEPFRETEPGELKQYLRIYYPEQNFASMNAALHSGNPAAMAEVQTSSHGKSGSDWRLTVVGPTADNRRRQSDVFEVGLIRGFGSFQLTTEPWKSRAPHTGFSAPAQVAHISPSAAEADAAFDRLRKANAPFFICDPYADASALERLGSLRGSRLLTLAKLKPTVNLAWAQRHHIEVRVLEPVPKPGSREDRPERDNRGCE